jgi:hypothetical protein
VVSGGGNLIKFGGGKKYPPDEITLADNILAGTGQLVRVSQGTHLHWQGNLINGGTAGQIPAGGYREADPALAKGPGGLYRLTAGSPAIDAASGSYSQVTLDLDGQARSGAKDTGAHEFSVAGTAHQPLTSDDVGPKAP